MYENRNGDNVYVRYFYINILNFPKFMSSCSIYHKFLISFKYIKIHKNRNRNNIYIRFFYINILIFPKLVSS